MTELILKLYRLATIRNRFLKLVFCCGPISFIVSGGESNPHLFDHCFDFSRVRYAERVNPALLATVCYFLKVNNKTYFHHSGWRGNSGNHAGNALDFHLTDYKGMNRSQMLTAFLDDVDLLQDFLDERGILHKVGLGIYPDATNPFIHLDFRGKRARWAELGGREVSFALAQDWARQEIARRGGNPSVAKKSAVVVRPSHADFAPKLWAEKNPWKMTNLKMFGHCFPFTEFPDLADVDSALLATLCYFVQTQGRSYVHRFQWDDTLGFSLRDYHNMHPRQILVSFFADARSLQTFLEKRGLWEKVRMGIYPQFARPFIQLDLHENPDHWGEVGGEKASFGRALDWMKGMVGGILGGIL